MQTTTRKWLAVARLEFAEVLRSRWIAFALVVYALLAGVFFLVALKESSVLGFTGSARVLLSFTHALVLLLPLLGLGATGQVVTNARHDGALELWFSHPVSRRGWFVTVSAVRYVALLVPLLALLVLLGVYARVMFGQAIPWGFVGRAAAVSAAILAAAIGLGMCISVWVRSRARALMWVLAAWALGVALLDFALIGLMLRERLPAALAFTLAGLNPVEAARLALLSAAEPSLSTLGPVGFFVAHRLGAQWLLAIGVAWPFTVGALAWWIALSRFQRGDLV